MFYRGMILPRVTGNYNPQTELLENVYKRSMKVLKETIDSAHSKTLDELYTDTFKPSHTKSDVTTVKSLKTGEPVEINLKYRLDGLNMQEQENRFKYSAYLSNNNKDLGSKTFGIKQKEGKNVFEGGFIVSAKNNKYSGVQIRLLQAACEEADKNGIKKMPLCSYLPAVKFHTMMGFRPTEQCNGEVRSLSDIAKETENFCRDYSKEIYEEDVTPILTKIGNVKAVNTSNTSNVQLLARAINGEARGEPYEGQVAVGAVILNRVKSSKFPNTIAGVIYQPGAFTAVSDGQIDVPIDSKSTVVKAAQDALNGWDPSGGAIYYFNPNTATNKWIWSRPLTTVIGKHRFCK